MTAGKSSAPSVDGLQFGTELAPLGGGAVLWQALNAVAIGGRVYTTRAMQLEARTFTSTLSHRAGMKWKGSWNSNKNVLIITRIE